jgi:hypothetical protein
MGRSCAPNVTLGLAGDGLLVVRAAEYLPAGTQVSRDAPLAGLFGV